jgi:hypothetical protein
VRDKKETKISKAYDANSMKQCPAEEANGSSSCPKKIQHLQNPEVHYRVHNRPALCRCRTETCSFMVRNGNMVVNYGGFLIN